MRALRSRQCSLSRTSFLGVLCGALALTALPACGGRRAEPAGPSASTPIPRPELVLLEGSVGELAQLREALPPELGAALPESALGLLEGTCAQLPAGARERVSPDARTVFVLVQRARTVAIGLVLAVPLRVDAGDAPLGAGVTLGALGQGEAPPGGRWLGGTPEAGRSALALVGDVLVCAQDAGDARAAAPYLARTLVPATRGDTRVAALSEPPFIVGAPLVAHAAADTVARELRRWSTSTLTEVGRVLTLSAQQAVAAHSTPPVLGDPVALVGVMLARLGQLAALLPDLATSRATVAPGGGGVIVSLRAKVRAGSPLDTSLRALPTIEPRALATLPRGTAVAALFPAEPVADRRDWAFGAGLADDLGAVAGARLTTDDANKLRDAVTDVGAARGTELVAALGRGLAGPFALLASGGASTSPSLEKLTTALDASYLRSATGLALGCSGEAGPHTVSAPIDLGGASLRMRDVCSTRAPLASDLSKPRGPRLDLASRGGAWALSITQLPIGPMGTPLSSIAARTASALAGADDGASLAADPATAHALAALPARVHFALAVLPEQLLAGASFFPIDVLVRAVSDAPEPPPGPPLLLALARDGEVLRLDLVLPTPALSRATETYSAAAALAR